MPSRENKNRQKDPEEVNDKSFVGNEEQQLESDQPNSGSDKQEESLNRDTYRSRNPEIEKERD